MQGKLEVKVLVKMDSSKIKVCLKGGGVFGRLGSYFECQMIINEVVLVSCTCFGDFAKVRENVKVNAFVVKIKWIKEIMECKEICVRLRDLLSVKLILMRLVW